MTARISLAMTSSRPLPILMLAHIRNRHLTSARESSSADMRERVFHSDFRARGLAAKLYEACTIVCSATGRGWPLRTSQAASAHEGPLVRWD